MILICIKIYLIQTCIVHHIPNTDLIQNTIKPYQIIAQKSSIYRSVFTTSIQNLNRSDTVCILSAVYRVIQDISASVPLHCVSDTILHIRFCLSKLAVYIHTYMYIPGIYLLLYTYKKNIRQHMLYLTHFEPPRGSLGGIKTCGRQSRSSLSFIARTIYLFTLKVTCNGPSPDSMGTGLRRLTNFLLKPLCSSSVFTSDYNIV